MGSEWGLPRRADSPVGKTGRSDHMRRTQVELRGTYVLKHSKFDRDKSEKDARGIGLTRAVLDSGRLRRV